MKVKVVKAGRYLVLRWTCPKTGKAKQKSARTMVRRLADRAAAKLEKELLEGTYFEPSRMTWEQFREEFEERKLPNLRAGTGTQYRATFNRFEALIGIGKLVSIDARVVNRFQNALRKSGVSETTISKHLRHLKAALNWGKEMGFIHRVPKIKGPRAGRHQQLMKGRPITDEEFQNMLDVLESIVGQESTESWQFFLKGLWLSGLRLGEALGLTWHPSGFFIDLSYKYPMFRISPECEKGERRGYCR